MNYFRQHPIISTILINLILFSAVFAFCFPILNSGDDAYLMYLLSGGFGNPPTELLHYQYIMHPAIGWLIKTAFVHFPGFNWYSFLLYCLHFLACCIVLYKCIQKNGLFAALGYYFLLFVIEMFFLLQLSFTNTAMVTATAATLLIYTGVQQKKSVRQLVPGFALLFAASLLRVHVLIPVIALAGPFIIAVANKRQIVSLLLPSVSVCILIAVAVFAHRQYYVKHIPAWQQEESYRATIIGNYNIPKKPANELRGDLMTRAYFLKNGILWDKDFLSEQHITATTAAAKLRTAASQRDFRARLFWLLIESRMGLLIMLFTFLLKNPSLHKKEKLAALASAIIFIGLCAFLLLFRKLPGYIVTAGMLQWTAFLMVSGIVISKPDPRSRVIIGATLAIFLWGIIRINKLNQSNIGQYSSWTCAYKEVSFHKDNLLIVTDDHFPVDYFHVWDIPTNYRLDNVLTKDHFLNNTYHLAFKKFGIQSLDTPGKISFIGVPSETLEEYYEKKTGRQYDALPAPQNSNCITIWGLY